MEKEVVVIGAGISGLTTSALLAKRGFKVTVIDAQFKPGGSCGIFKSKEVFDFFDKLTSTYCYTNVYETPVILSSVMFVDNHFGGSYYPAGSTLNLVGKLEKVIEENNGQIL